MPNTVDFGAMLLVAIAEARKGLAEGGIPIGAAIFNEHGTLVGSEMAIHPCTERPTPSATLVASAATKN